MSATSSPAAPATTPGVPVKFSPEVRAEVDLIVKRYPWPRGALLPLLHIAQREFGYLSPEVQVYVGSILGLPPTDVLATASFYPMYRLHHAARHVIRVCATLPCALGGCRKITHGFEKALGIKAGEVSSNGILLEKVECIAACDQAPAVLVDEDLLPRVTEAQIPGIVEKLRS